MERFVVERYHSSLFPQHIRERIGTSRVVKVTIEASDADEQEAAAFDQAVISAVADLDDGKAISADTALASLFARFGPPTDNLTPENSVKLSLAPSAEASLHQFCAVTRDHRVDSGLRVIINQTGFKLPNDRVEYVSDLIKDLFDYLGSETINGYPIHVSGIGDLTISEHRTHYITHRLKGDTREIIRISTRDHDVKGYRFTKKVTALEWSKLGVDVASPIAVVEDRYGGIYSGGRWLAIAAADTFENGLVRVAFCVEEGSGPSGDDGDAMDFWKDAPDWIASGDTPDAAIEKLRQQVLSEETSEI